MSSSSANQSVEGEVEDGGEGGSGVLGKRRGSGGEEGVGSKRERI